MKLVEEVRLSLGTAIHLGLESGDPIPDFTTAFLMTYSSDKCAANCAFCPQAQDSEGGSDKLSRIGWPSFPFSSVLDGFEKRDGFQRICIQCLNYPEVVDDVCEIIRSIKAATNSQVSVCIHPVPEHQMKDLRAAGTDRIGIALDACTPKLFDKIKGIDRNAPYQWEKHLTAISQAMSIFGKTNVTTHLIVGLGETEKEAVEFLLDMYDRGITVGLFAFTPIKGTELENIQQPDIHVYRRIQAIRYLRHRNLINRSMIEFTDEGATKLNVDPNWLANELLKGNAFRTSGCPHCNRPYYNERPSGPMYNYPRRLSEEEAKTALEESGLI
jgi:biotin synthase